MQVILPPVASISAGTFWTCALTQAHKVYCWGYNGYEQIGLDRPRPNPSSPSRSLGSNVSPYCLAQQYPHSVAAGWMLFPHAVQFRIGPMSSGSKCRAIASRCCCASFKSRTALGAGGSPMAAPTADITLSTCVTAS